MTRMNTLTKLLCALLVLCGLLCCAGAAGAEVVASGDCSAEGSSVQWTLDDAGTFTVSGTGAMADYTPSTRPWADYYDSVTNLVIEDGVTAIGNSSFYECSNLTSVEMPDSVTSIGKSAFSKCAGLTSLDLPDNVTFIGREAFYTCTGLTSLTIPASVTEMSDAFYGCSGLTDITISDGVTSIYDAFNRCTGLTSITIPDSVTSIRYAFHGCTGLESIVVPDSVTEMEYAFVGCTGLRSANIPSSVTSIDGAFTNCTSLTSIEIPDSVTTIGNFAFSDCTGLTSIAIPDSVTTIGSSAFDGCTSLTSIEIPDSVTTIIDQAFDGCTGLKSVAIPNSVTEIDFNAFEGCTQVSTVIISCTPNGAVCDCIYQNFSRAEQIYVHAYENGACTDCGVACTHEGGTLGTPVPTEDGTQHAATYTCCGAVVTGNHTYEDGACSACRAECSHTFTDGACTVCGLTGGYCGASTNEGGEQSVTWTLADNHLVISGEGAMVDYASSGVNPWYDARQTITDVTIGEGVTRIGKYAFYNFQSLAEITIPASVVSIGYQAFGSSTVSSVTFAPNSRLTAIDDYAFQYVTALKQITLPASVETIGNRAFESCIVLETVTFAEGSRLSSIGYLAFGFCNSLTAISVPESVTAYKTIDGVLYSGDGTTLLCYPAGRTDPFTTPAGVTAIAESAFVYAQVPSVTLSEGVTTLGAKAFGSCRLQSVSLPSTLTSIGNSAFASCFHLVTVSIPANVTSIGDYAFADCTDLTEVTIPASVSSIGMDAFSGCNNLTTVNAPCNWDGSLYTFEDTVTVVVADHAFADGACTACGLNGGYCGAAANAGGEQSVVWTYKDGVLSITGTGAMADFDDAPWYSSCDSVTSLTISEGVTSIGEFAFWGFTRLKSVTIPASVTKLGYGSFSTSGLESVTFAEESQLISIADYAFQNCDALTEITLPAGVTSITRSTFSSCTSLTSIRVAADNVTYKDIGGVLYTADGKTLMVYPAGRTAEAFTTPEGVTTIGDYAFANNYYIKTVTLSEGVTTIEVSVFNGCVALQTVDLPDSLTTIGKQAFCCTGLTSIDIPAGVTMIDWGAFESCSSLTNVVIPEGVETIGLNTFAWCSSLATVTIPASVKAIHQSAFCDCNALTTANVPCSWDGSLYTFADTVTVNYTHTEGEPTCQGTFCTVCGEICSEESDPANHTYASNVCCGYCGGEGDGTNVKWSLTDGVFTVTGTGAMADFGSSDIPWSSYKASITSLTIAEGVTSISKNAFSGSGITRITIPASVESVGMLAFQDCSGLAIVEFADGSRLTTIDSHAFAYCTALMQITVPASVSSLDSAAFVGCEQLTGIVVASGNTTYQAMEGVLYRDNGTTLLYYPMGRTEAEFSTPEGVTSISADAFRDAVHLETLNMTFVTYLDAQAFGHNETLITVVIPPTLSSIDSLTFSNCAMLTTVHVPCSWDSSLYTFADTVTVNVANHTGGTATCQSGAICGNCYAEYGDLDESNHVGAELTWEWYPRGETAYACVSKTCPACEECYDSASGDGTLLSETEGTDCLNPGTRTYTATLTWNVDETEVTGTYTEIIPCDNHVGTFSNGFCTACHGFEKPAVALGEYDNEEWDDTYLISNAGQLYWFAAEVNSGSNGIGARLTANISVPASVSKGGSIPDWTPIGTGYSYCGDFSGAGHTISGLYCKANYAGLFGTTGYNYPLTNLGVTNSTFIGGSYAGAITGYAESSMSGCWASGNTVEGNYAGGLAGQNIGFITGSRASNNTVKGELAGGLVGYNNNGTIARSYAAGNTVTGNAPGGLVGENYGTIENSYATGNTPGYLVNYNGDPITNCYTDGSALFRDSYGDVTNSYYVSAAASDDGGRTSDQFASGEIAYLLQAAIEPEEVYDEETGEYTTVTPLVWGQSIGSATFPTLGGAKVYQVLACDGKGTAYANTDEPQQHSYTDSVCDNCGAPCEHAEFTDCVCNGCGYVCTHEEFADDACTICGIPGGYCGNVQEGYEATSMKWLLQGGVLTVTGTGPMGEISVPEASVPDVTAVTVAEGVTSIAGYACKDFPALKTVTLPATVSAINAAAFEGCTSLERVSIPENSQLQYIGSSAFESCSSLKGIELPASLKTIEANAFAYSGLVSIDLPEGVTSIGSLAFVRCLSLQTVTIPKSVKTISESAFNGCEALANVYVPCSWDTKPLYDFDASIALNIADHALSGGVCGACGFTCPHDTGNGGVCSICGKTVNRVLMILPANLTVIESEAFTGTAAVAIVIPAKCTSIAAGAFTGCGSLAAVIFTSADCTIADGAIPAGTAIVAPAGGTVETWAEANGITFIAR